MSNHWKELVRLHFKGKRYRDHALDLNALSRLNQFQKIIAETAKELWRKAHPERERLPKYFEERTRLYLRTIEDGSAVAPLEAYLDENEQGDLMEGYKEPEELVKAIKATHKLYDAAGKNTTLPEEFPKELIPEFAKWCEGLEDDEEIILDVPDTGKTNITNKHSEKLMPFAEEPYHDYVEVDGEVLEADVKKRKFQLWLNDTNNVTISFSENQEDQVTSALKDHNSLRLRIKGRGVFTPRGKLIRVLEVDNLIPVPIEGEYFNNKAKPIGEILDAMVKEIPESEISKLPKDISGKIDDIIYGNP